MAISFITKLGNSLEVVEKDGTRTTAYPIGGGMWLASGGGSGPGPDPFGLFVQPFPSDTISSPYGPRTGVGQGTFHEGTDWGAGNNGGVGASIKAVGAGTVQTFTAASAFGNVAIIDHGVATQGTHAGKRIRSLYAHMAAPSPLSIGQAVVAGTTVVGGIGNTGASEGAHLHLEIHVSEPGSGIVWNTNNDGGFRTAVDPLAFFDEYGTL